MRKVFSALSIILVGCFNFSYALFAQSSVIPFIQNVSTKIIVTSKESPFKFEVIKALLELQSSLIIPVQNPIPDEFIENGYLLIKMTPKYVENLLFQKNGLIVGAYQGEILVGYILLIDIFEFKELYQDVNMGYIETLIDLKTLETLLSKPTVGYIEQIAVRPGYSKTGLDTQLINASKELKPDGLVADVFIDPLTNKTSLRFFSQQGFEKSGTLHQYPRDNVPFAHRTQVFFWNLIPAKSY